MAKKKMYEVPAVFFDPLCGADVLTISGDGGNGNWSNDLGGYDDLI